MAHSDSGKAEQIISEFYLKSLQIILESRIPCIRSQYQNTDHCVSGSSRSKRRDKWFSLAVGECLMAAECMNMWYKNVGGPLVLDVILVQETGSEGEGSSLGVGRLLKQNSVGVSSPRGQPLNSWGVGSDNITSSRTSKQTIIERWVLQCESLRGSTRNLSLGKIRAGGGNAKYEDGSTSGRSNIGGIEVGSPQMSTHSIDGHPVIKRMYKRLTISLRSIYATSRLLPAYELFRMLNTTNNVSNFNLSYKVSSFSEPFSRTEEEFMKLFNFSPLETPFGQLNASVWYRTCLSDLNIESSTLIAPQIIVDYVGSPAADPLKIFSSGSPAQSMDRSGRATSFPVQQFKSPSSAPFQRPHSWTSGLHRAAPYTHTSSSPSNPLGTSPSPSTSSDANVSPSSLYMHQNRYHNHHLVGNSPPISSQMNAQRSSSFSSRSLAHKKVMNTDEYWPSPPFSPSSSPSPPTNSSGRNLLLSRDSRRRFESAPVSIPQPLSGRSPAYPTSSSSESNRFPLPPPSPKFSKPESFSQDDSSRASIGNNLGYQEYSESKSFRKLDSLKPGEFYPGTTNLHIYSGSKVLKDCRDDSGRFSGMVSSSSSPRIGFSRSSSRVSFQDELDDYDFSCPFAVDDVDVSDSPKRSADSKESSDPAQVFLPARKSQDAAVGMLVHMLRTAPPLRQDRSYYSQASRSEFDGGDLNDIGASGFLISRKASDALEELRSYKAMKDLLLSQSRIQPSDH
ncbi:Autophagy-related protein 13b [Nymphaea thermarum]|nr:Autophagy-related protein 13b [Nymphaea thermarum]